MENIRAFINQCSKRKIVIVAKDGKLTVNAPENSLLAEDIAFIKSNKSLILAVLEQISGNSAVSNDSSDINVIDRSSMTSFPVSYAQQRLWLVDKMQEGSSEYNVPVAFKVNTAFSVEAANKAINEIIRRHEPLRTHFDQQGDEIVQVIKKKFKFSLDCHDLTQLNEDDKHNKAQELIAQDTDKAFDLAKDLMIRGSFIQLSATPSNVCIVLFNLHHIACDGWSTGILIDEFIALYQGFVNGNYVSLPKLSVQYVDYAHWQRQWLSGERLDNQLDYWKQQLVDVPIVHSLPLDKSRPAKKMHTGEVISKRLSYTLSQQINELATDNNITTFMLLHGALALVISRHSNNNDIVIGVPVANRQQTALESLIGFFVNTLVLRANTSHKTLSNYLAHIRQVNLDAQANQDVSLEQLLTLLNIPRSVQYTPLFQLMFSMDTTDVNENEISTLDFSLIEEQEYATKFDLEINASIDDAGIFEFSWLYDNSIFDSAHIELLSEHLSLLLAQFVSTPSANLSDLSMLSASEIINLKPDLSIIDADIDNEKTGLLQEQLPVHRQFELQVERTPNNIAIVDSGVKITYQKLNDQANQLAHHLNAHGICAGSLVGISLERSELMLTSVLAVLKSGAAYLPLDPKYPAERLNYLCSKSKISSIITLPVIVERCFSSTSLQVIIPTECRVEQHSKENLVVNAKEVLSHLAYVIYTSGSTGQPKGVMIEHSQLAHYLSHCKREYFSNNLAGAVVNTPLSFDATVTSLFTPLLLGKQVVLLSSDQETEIKQLCDYLSAKNTDWLFKLTPAHLQIITSFEAVKSDRSHVLVVGGEALAKNLVINLLQKSLPNSTVINEYGPTEATVGCCTYTINLHEKFEDLVEIPIGKAINNSFFVVLDKMRNLSPFGAIGELYIGGVGVANGYLHQPELTKQRFVVLPNYSPTPLYQSGDLVRYLPNGELTFVGRTDSQIKLRGFRIELGEIEHHLQSADGVSSAIALITSEIMEEKSIVAYVVLATETTEDDNATLVTQIKNHLQQNLPDYMIPTVITILDKWPLTDNGKIDRRALPLPVNSKHAFRDPTSNIEISLRDIWAEILQCSPKAISTKASFFELGGNSLTAIKMITEITKQLNVELSLATVLANLTIESLSNKIFDNFNDTEELTKKPIIKVSETENCRFVASFAQQRLWLLYQLNKNSSQYNMPMAFNVTGAFDITIAQLAIRQIIKRHLPLRTTFEEHDEIIMQRVNETSNFEFLQYDLTQETMLSQHEKTATIIADENEKPFDLTADLMIRGSYIHLSNELTGVLLLTLHHIACDGWSISILYDEFFNYYHGILKATAKVKNQNIIECEFQDFEALRPLSPLPVQYTDYAAWQHEWLMTDTINQQLDYWSRQLEDIPVTHSLPLAQKRPSQKKDKGNVIHRSLPLGVSQNLQHIAAEHDLTTYMMIHAALALVLSRHSNSYDIVIGTPFANRSQNELQSLIGFFVNTLVLRVNTEHKDLVDYLKHVREVNLAAQTHQDVPFEQLVDLCKVPRNMSHTPLFQIALSMEVDTALPIENITLSTGQQVGEETLLFTPAVDNQSAIKFDLEINASISIDGALEFSWLYDISIFTHEQIEKMSGHLSQLLTSISRSPNEKLQELSMLSEDDLKLINQNFNNEFSGYPRSELVHQVFENKAKKYPYHVAVEFQSASINYEMLNCKANQLAHYLMFTGVKVGDKVGVCLERTPELIITLLAILKAGAAYVPIDSSYPNSHIENIIQDSGLNFMVTSSTKLQLMKLPIEGILTTVLLDELVEKISNCSGENVVLRHLTPKDSIAYIIYTSGSTGMPKGVEVTHQGINRLVCKPNFMSLDDSTRFLQAASIAFDAATLEIWGALLNGGCSVLYPDAYMDLTKLSEVIQRYQVTALWLTAGLFEQFSHVAYNIPSLKWLLAGGDILNGDAIKRMRKSHDYIQIINGYGPTENTTFTCCFPIEHETNLSNSIPIGRNVNGTQSYVLSLDHSLAPIGSIGELHIAGDGLAKGYCNNEQLTNEKFSYNNVVKKRLYASGDLVRYLPDGNIEFIGRNDEQVKIRGFRVELTEIEECLIGINGIESALVQVIGSDSTDKYLVAYLILTSESMAFDNESLVTLKQQLGMLLPAYMIPSHYASLTRWPLTINGKIDKKLLLQHQTVTTTAVYVEPSNTTEKAIAVMWSKLLKLDQQTISVEANFFELGGHSLLATRMITELREAFALEVEMKIIFETKTLKELAVKVAAQVAFAEITKAKSHAKINKQGFL